jgi:Arc/MetJ-type ribon-helix-helix transcriptional regulator
MGKPPPSEPVTRKSVTLPNSLWAAISEARKDFGGHIPSEAEVIRILLREALDARARRVARGAKK